MSNQTLQVNTTWEVVLNHTMNIDNSLLDNNFDNTVLTNMDIYLASVYAETFRFIEDKSKSSSFGIIYNDLIATTAAAA